MPAVVSTSQTPTTAEALVRPRGRRERGRAERGSGAQTEDGRIARQRGGHSRDRPTESDADVEERLVEVLPVRLDLREGGVEIPNALLDVDRKAMRERAQS